MDPTRRFADRARDYVKFRPDYPEAAIDAILAGLGPASSLTTADVGAGTGIATRQLAARGVHVIALEPNPAMREAAAAHPHVVWRDGTAEATGLAAESVDLVVCAQAFHWFRQSEAIAEFHRILRAGGRLALMWNSRDVRHPLTRAYVEAIHAVNGEHPAERRGLEPGVVDGDGRFSPPRLETFEHHQRLDRSGLIGRAASASYVPKEGPRFEDLSRRLEGLFDRHRDELGVVQLRYVTQLYLTERR